jgi:hypothetical protein
VAPSVEDDAASSVEAEAEWCGARGVCSVAGGGGGGGESVWCVGVHRMEGVQNGSVRARASASLGQLHVCASVGGVHVLVRLLEFMKNQKRERELMGV